MDPDFVRQSRTVSIMKAAAPPPTKSMKRHSKRANYSYTQHRDSRRHDLRDVPAIVNAGLGWWTVRFSGVIDVFL